MIVSIKDGAKLAAISVMMCCAVLVCTLFLNYNMDLKGIEALITEPQPLVLYEALTSMGKAVSAVSGGCLLLTSGIMLLFYIKNYIDAHKKELGILKALGYSNMQIAKDFYVFALSVFIGAALGFGGAFLLMPTFYRTQNEEGFFPDFTVQFHPSLFIALVIIPTVAFGVLAIFYACVKLKRPTIDLLKEKLQVSGGRFRTGAKEKNTEKETGFLQDMRKATIRGKKALLFFVVFGSFCFSSMMQMSASMDMLASEMFSIMIFTIGVLLSGITLFLSLTSVVHGNTKTISMMRVFGYTSKNCKDAVLGGYRIPAYIGFAVGTVYQYGLLKMTLEVIFKDWEEIPEYNFDVQAFIVVLLAFVALYELIMYGYARKIRKISLKEVMLE
ncbi:MAG: ABC transporter permease [Roseburia sp.]|nr:ABC transporter permease [Roseburia sp.]MCM1242315.1 ABC transporter permease [Roseburia sp.]